MNFGLRPRYVLSFCEWKFNLWFKAAEHNLASFSHLFLSDGARM